AAKPLMVMDGILVAQAPPAQDGDLVIVTLDSKQGTAKERKNIKLPPGPAGECDRRPGPLLPDAGDSR
ncbi:MAG TPA: hypothetical protein VLE27_05215, partial [Thermoanaerobaculia bacterium]|nr:hypothetical protein [Thermoanaerobaculia bacterium]